MFFFTGTPALRAGFGDNSALATALGTGSNIGEAAKDTLLDSAHLPAAITVGALAGLSVRSATSTLTQGAVLSAQYIYLLFGTKGCLLQGDSNPVVKVSTGLWCLAGGGSCPSTKESFKEKCRLRLDEVEFVAKGTIAEDKKKVVDERSEIIL